MSSYYSVFTYSVWLLGLGLQAAILGVLVRRKLWRQVPIFTTYLAFILVRGLALLVVLRFSYDAYFYAYWAGEAIALALGLAVIQETMQRLFAPYEAVSRLLVLLFRWAAGVLLGLAALTAYITPGADAERLMAGILVLERSVRIVQVGLLSLLFVFAAYFRLKWPRHVLGIAVGMALFCAVELAAVTLRSHLGHEAHDFFVIAKPVAYLAALGLWLYYAAVPAPAVAPRRAPAHQLDQWNLALLELLRR